MPIVNYIREHMRFIEYASDEKLSSSERLLWYALMHLFNQRAQGNRWPDDFIRISNDRLLSLCPMGFDAMAKARNSLKQRGLIEFTKGEKNRTSPAYRMIYFMPDCPVYPQYTDNVGGNMGDNVGGNVGGKPWGKAGDININNTIDSTQTGPRKMEEDTNRRYQQVRAAIRDSWIRGFGRPPTPAVVDLIERWGARVNQMETDVIAEAIRRAALRGAEDPAGYAIALLRDWGLHRIRTMEELEGYLDEE